MSDLEGFVIEYRKIMQWEWYTDVNTAHLFRHCILRANYTDTAWRGIEVKRGSFITSLQTLSTETGLSVMQVRTALAKLEKTEEITSKTTSKYRIISVKNYDLYQQNNKQSNKRNNKQNSKVITSKSARKQQGNNNQITTDNNIDISKDISINKETSGGVCPTGTHTPPQKENKAASSFVSPVGVETSEPLSRREWRTYCELKGYDEYRAAEEWIKVEGVFTESQKRRVREWLKQHGEE